MENSKKRLKSVDLAKGLGIICLLNFLLKKCKAYFKGKKAVPSSIK